MNSRNNGGKENGFSYSCQKCEKDVVKKTKKIWILKTLYGKHLLDFRNTWYSNLKILYESKSYFFRVECHPLMAGLRERGDEESFCHSNVNTCQGFTPRWKKISVVEPVTGCRIYSPYCCA